MILITGGTGLIGAQLLYDLVKSGQSVRALKRNNSSLSIVNRIFKSDQSLLSKIEWVEGDIMDIYSIDEAMKEVQYVYHSAAFISFIPSEISRMMKVNIEGTANMVNAALVAGVKKFCHVSSVAAIGRSMSQNHMDETFKWKTSKENSNYAISKYKSEQEVWRGIEEGLSAVIVNPTMVLGPGDYDKGSTELFGSVKKGLKFYSEGVNGFVDVRDVSKSMIALMNSSVTNQRFIITSESISYKELFFGIADAFGKPRPTIKVNKWMSEAAWRVEAIRSRLLNKKPFLTRETAQSSQYEWFYSNDKIRKQIGIEFIPVQQAIKETVQNLTQPSPKERA